jgi:hypothetical protein
VIHGDGAGKDQLPAHARMLNLAGAGHLPMTDDPAAVASLIARTAEPDTGRQGADGIAAELP